VRHLGSLLVSAVGGVMLYICLGVGSVRLQRASELLADGARRGSLELLLGVALVLVAGLCVALLLTVRWSPLGLALLGIALGAAGGLAVADPRLLARLLPDTVLGVHGIRSAPPVATMLVAVPLLLTVLSARRWRGSRSDQPFSSHPIDGQM